MDGLRIDQWINLATSLLTGLVILGGMFVGYKKWIRSVANTARQSAKDTANITKEIRTSNGHTLGQIIEESDDKLKELVRLQTSRMDEQDVRIERLVVAQEMTNSLLSQLSQRFDSFLLYRRKDE